MISRSALTAAVLMAVAACSPREYDDVAYNNPGGADIRIGYDTAVVSLDAHAQAAGLCAGSGRRAVWYGHDRDGNLRFKCE